MGETHGRVGDIDVLAAGAGAAVRVDPQVFLVDVDLAAQVLEERHHRHRREAGLTPVLGVEGGHAHQAVHTAFGGHQPRGVTALDDEGGGKDARLLAQVDVVYLQGEAPALDPALVHAQQHLGPVLGVGAPVLGVHLADGVELVVLAGEQRAELELVELGRQGGNSSLELTGNRVVRLLLGQLVKELGVRQSGAQAVQKVDVVLQRRVLPGGLLGSFRVVP